jgi:tRNA uridine 5-carboxymethylaminomethyl modification enzyme
MDKIASMPCSPSIGGMAKGQLVKEIDALGGQMAKITDSSAIQYKTLNTSKGPAVHSTRTQNDKGLYSRNMKAVIEQTRHLDLKQAMAHELRIENRAVTGITDQTGFEYSARAVVIATGTFLQGTVHIGATKIQAGRAGEFSSIDLAQNLAGIGFSVGRMKTGTPPRLHADTIDF